MNLTAGAVLKNGKYVLDAPLGQGIFGITYRATHTQSGKAVVIKTLSDSLRTHPDFERFGKQFLTQARRLARCKHPHLVRVLDLFEESRRCFIVMEFIPGQTLAESLLAGQLLPEAQALGYIRQIGSALTVIHKAGLLHRDIKPQNIIRRPGTEDVVLIDVGFGDELTPGVTQTQASLVNPGYAPIEQYLAQEKLTPATDVYALAASLYCLLTGQPPVPAPLRERIPLPNLREIQPKLSPTAIAAILCGLEIKAEKRPQTVEDWLSLLPASKAPEVRTAQTARRPATPKSQPAPQKRQTASNEKQKTSMASGVNWNLSQDVKRPGKTRPYKTQLAKVSAAPKKLKTAIRATLPIALAKLKTFSFPIETSEAMNRVSTKLGSSAGIPRLQNLKFPKLTLARGLMMTAAIATCTGAGFGLAVRFHGAMGPGSSILHTEQSFPPRDDWPISDTPNPTSSANLLSPPAAVVAPGQPSPDTLPKPEL
ncbi:serine/threonine-protein kinase [Coleofasciculus sp. FACHB-1120]|uniref:serine/threonine protein kinase n=1 Tax=Coleofasciculus sp. FACHB-1120 TaxID=2692783 RepID=UPI0016887700|nr:serine/threonine-protein kinase [Coleofasciculus sp. FACHB-1120]MBD2744247.1 serine/threonine protein kinase [Coleofasciculus sp. FACHB-1120]